ncbi:MAG: hypothetical protein JHC84_15780 [Solirubrobacteraceae bacterium]|nr:hypothetical protein [Solirubrobacteraceae bacterium]
MTPLRLLACVTPVLTALLVVPAAAQACGSQDLRQPLLPLSDAGWYLPVDNADFEDGDDDWKLSRASLVRGNEPWKVLGSRHTMALRLNAGGTALSDQVCVTVDHTHSRFFARALTATGSLRVDVLWDNEGRDQQATVLTLSAAQFKAWAPSPIAPMAPAVKSLYEDEEDELVALKFTAVSGTWEIDDVLVDPYRRR